MAIEFNTSPYYDDFDKTKNFYRILFKPGRAVQARELTQLQSILQYQIEAHGSHIFRNGSIVDGARALVTYGTFFKVSSGNVDVFDGENIVGSTSGATATVVKVANATTINEVDYPAAIYVNNITGTFLPGETVTIDGTTTSIILLNDAIKYTGPSVFFNLGEGIFYVNGFFVYCDPQTIVVSKTFKNDPSARIGLAINEQIVTSDDDSSLLDPAIGSNNYFAPGADRLQIELVLSSIEYNSNVENSDTETIENFIEIANFRDGDLIRLKTDSDYNKLEDTLAKRTFDESGDYTVKPFIAKLKPHHFGNVDKFTVEISPGKAYVKGYAFETIAPTNLTVDKARDFDSVEDFEIAADYGRYTDVIDVKGFLNSHKAITFDLHRQTVANVILTSNVTYTSNLIGSAKIRYVDHVSSSPDRYSLYLYDIVMKSGNTFSEVKSFIYPNTVSSTYTIIASANTVNSANDTILTYDDDDTLLFPVPQSYVKTFEPEGTPTISFNSKRFFENVTFAAGTGADSGNSIATISVTGNENFIGTAGVQDDAFIKDRFYAANTTGHVLDFTGSGSITLNGTLQQAVLRVVNGNTFAANLSVLTNTSQASPKTKTLTTANVVIDYTTSQLNVLYLNRPDIVSVTKIEDSQGNSYLGSYLLDTGQRDDYYDHGILVAANGAVVPVLDANNNPNVTVTFNYLAHSGTSPFFNIDSYISSGVLYENIPTYTTSTGKKVNLADVLDFRPVREPNSNTLIITQNITPGSTIDCDYQYYLSRADKIVITKDKTLNVIKGIPAVSPDLPKDSPDAMTIYTLNIPPYTKSPDAVQLGFIENRRFTMRDIGKIEKRVDRLEYYTTLSFLEKVAADLKIPSSVPGIDRFKNGILVDPFSGHGIGDIKNGDYICSIDNENRLLRPAFSSESVNYEVDYGVTTARVTGDLITPNYTEIPFISQTKATQTVFLTPYEVFNFVGQMTLTPATDIWYDTTKSADVTVNLNGENDAFTQIVSDSAGLTPWATKWNAWQSAFRGVTDVSVSASTSSTVDTALNIDEAGNLSTQSTTRSDTTTTTDVTTGESFARTGLQFSSGSKTITTRLGAKLIDSSLIPYIRSRPVNFVAKHLKPNTEMFATFDDIDVTTYCYPAIKLSLSANITANSTVLTVDQPSTNAKGNVILQKNNILYIIPDITRPVFTTANVTLNISSGAPLTNRSLTNVDVRTDLITNEFGELAGTFIIPNNQELKFNVGERRFKLADSLNKLFIQSSAQTTYLAQGLSNTTQDTILATRMNLVSIDPLQEFKQETAGALSKTATNSTTVVGEKSTVALPPTTQVTNNFTTVVENNTIINNTVQDITNVTKNVTDVNNYYGNLLNNINVVNNLSTSLNNANIINNLVNISTNLSNVSNSIINNNVVINNEINLSSDFVNVGILDLFCGQAPQGSGKQGTYTYRINLGEGSLGYANITVWPGGSGICPDRFTLDYRGTKTTTGFISTSSPSSAKNQQYSKDLIKLGFPGDITQVNATTGYKFTVYKQTPKVEYAYLTIDAPLKGTAWRFNVECPTGSANPSPGTAKVVKTRGPGSPNFVTNYLHYYGNNLQTTPEVKIGTQFTITNTSSIPTWKVPGDGVVRVKSITIDTSEVEQPIFGVETTFAVETTGFSYQVYRGVDEGIWNDPNFNITPGEGDGIAPLEYNYFFNNNNKAPANKLSPSWTNTLGALPVDIPRGESRTFTITMDHPAGAITNGKLKVKLDLTNSAETANVAHADIVIPIKTKNIGKVWIEDPVAQTFFVDGSRNPNGIFISSVDLWFAEKSSSIPVRVEIRPVVNGYPSSTEILPFGAVTLDAEQITVSSSTNSFKASEFTRFTFPSPVYCPPGQYAIVAIGNDPKYRIYSAVLGQFELDTGKQVSEQPYIGSMFKSQNSVTWTAEQYEDMTFRINRASFDSEPATVKLDSLAYGHSIPFDVYYTFGETLSFPGTVANYEYKKTDLTTDTLDDFTPFLLGNNIPMLNRKVVKANVNNSLQLKATLQTEDDKVAPVIDLNRISSVLVRNIANNDSTGEDNTSGGNAEARYITRRVTLAPGFEAQDLKVYVDAYCPAGTSFKVYYKVNAPGTTQFDSQNKYVEMVQTGVTGNTLKEFAEYTFENSGNSCLPDGASFNIFTIKIVMLSSNPAVVPILKDLRVLAVDDF